MRCSVMAGFPPLSPPAAAQRRLPPLPAHSEGFRQGRRRWIIPAMVSLLGGATCPLLIPGEVSAGQTGMIIPLEYLASPTIFTLISLLMFALLVILLVGRYRLLSATEQLAASERRYHALFAGNAAIMLLVDPESCQILDANEAATAFYGWNREEMTGKSVLDIAERWEVAQEHPVEWAPGCELRKFPSRHRVASGQVRDVETCSMPYMAERRECLLTIVQDVSGLKQAEAERRRSEVQASLLVESAPIPIYVHVNGSFVYLNPAAVYLFGARSAEALVGTPVLDRIAQRFHALAQERIRIVTEEHRPVPVIEMEFRRLDGTPVEVEINAVPFAFNGSEAVLVFVSDITSRRDAERMLRQSESRYRLLFERMPAGCFLYDGDLRITDCNERFPEILSSSRERLVGLDMTTINDQAPIPVLRGALAGSVGHHEGHYRATTSDVEVWASLAAAPLYGSDGTIIGGIAIVEDITDRKSAEAALRASEEKFRGIFETTLEGIFQTTPEGRIRNINPALAHILGYRSTGELLSAVTDVGAQVYVEPAKRREIERLMAAGGIIKDFETELYRKDGSTVWVSINSSAVRDEGGMIEYYQGGMIDISDRKLMDDRMRASLREKELLLKEIHHRVKNNLQIISSLLNLQAHHLRDEVLIALFRESQNRVRTMAMIHEKLYRSKDLASIDFGSYLEELAQYLFHCFPAGADAQLHLDVADVTFGIDTAVPCGLLVNELISNALKYAFPDGQSGMVSITLYQDGDRSCVLTVADDGVGLPAGFDVNSATTLGMELISSLIRQLDGHLEIVGTGGTTFTITFTPQH